MVTQELITYIKKSLAEGKSRADLEKELFLSGGWSASDLNDAFKAIEISAPNGAPIIVQKVSKQHKTVRLIWVIVLMLIAGYCGWWIRDRQQFLQFPIPFVRG